jgi:hypothetical protein
MLGSHVITLFLRRMVDTVDILDPRCTEPGIGSAYHYRRRRRKIYIHIFYSAQESTMAHYSVHPAPSSKRSRPIHQEHPRTEKSWSEATRTRTRTRGTGREESGRLLAPSCSPRGLESTHARKRQALLFARLIFLNHNMAQIQTGKKGVSQLYCYCMS